MHAYPTATLPNRRNATPRNLNCAEAAVTPTADGQTNREPGTHLPLLVLAHNHNRHQLWRRLKVRALSYSRGVVHVAVAREQHTSGGASKPPWRTQHTAGVAPCPGTQTSPPGTLHTPAEQAARLPGLC